MITVPPYLVNDLRCVFYLAPLGNPNGGTIFKDRSPSRKTITAYGNVCNSTTQKKFPPASIYFDGNGDYLSVADSPNWNFGNSGFGISGWFYIPSTSTGDQPIVGQIESNGHSPMYIGYSPSNSNRMIYLFGPASNAAWTNGDNYIGSQTISRNAWHHFSFYRNPLLAYNQWNAYIDGVLDWQYTSTVTLYDSSQPMTIGYYQYNGTYSYLNGYIDELAIWGNPIPIEKLYPQTRRMII